jgi:WD40 repeat protein
MDNCIRAYDSVGNPLLQFQGHNKGVISFSWTKPSDDTPKTSLPRLISGSWDGTAKVWSFESNPATSSVTATCDLTLGPHENGVHVLGATASTTTRRPIILTTSTGEAVNSKPANFKLRTYDAVTGQLIGVPIQDHAGSLRCLCALSETADAIGKYVTGSNDGSANIRLEDGTVVGSDFHSMQDDGSPPFILDW